MPLPNFLIVGAPKCGTTAMHVYLRRRPDVFMPDKKEPHYFADDVEEPGYIRDRRAYAALFEQANDAAAIGAAMPGAGNLAIPLVAQLTKNVGATNADAKGYVHWGATSQDVIDTGLVLQLRDALALVDTDVDRLAAALAKRAWQHADTLLAGRTFVVPEDVQAVFPFVASHRLAPGASARVDRAKLALQLLESTPVR